MTTTDPARARTVRLYTDVLGLPVPEAVPDGASDPLTIAVPPADLRLLRLRLLAAGAPVEDETATSLSFRDPEGVRVVLVAGSPD